MLSNRERLKTMRNGLNCSFKELIKITAADEKWGGEVQIPALPIALSHPIYSDNKFDNNPDYGHYIPSVISIQEMIDRFDQRTAGSNLKYIGYKSDMNKLSLCIHFTGNHNDALLPVVNNPQEFIPKP